MPTETTSRILVVDDDAEMLRAHQRILTRAGLTVDTAENGRAALEMLSRASYGAVVSDIAMPEMDGVSFLRAVRDVDLDLPVLLVTGSPDVTTAAAAVQYGAFRYLTKPVPAEILVGAVRRAARLHEWAVLRRTAHLGDRGADVGDRAAIDASLTRALKSMWMAFQPIVSYRAREVFAYEALMRTSEPALPHPGAVLEAALRVGRHAQVGQRVRQLVAATLDTAPSVTCFVNLHVRDLADDALYEDGEPLSRHAERVVLELTERSPLDEVGGLRARLERLRKLGFRLAVDDLGAGYSGLTSLAQLDPEVVKVDMSLVRDVDSQPIKQKLIASLQALARDLDKKLVLEGVETPAERDFLVETGCDLFQGYLFARPAKPFTDVAW
ncbi:MAG: EAL domain-containing response regulator [Labilithrix sp.]|nr:EAL domain-containing response regulator [Labilithrix sp.]MCW5812503.1 EAL domain-containing response regulator [Labilithrix sp.]